VFTDAGLDRRFYELCALAELKNALRSGDIWVQGSRQFKDFDEYLIPSERFSALREANRLSLAVATDCEAYLKDRLCRLEQQLETVDRIAQSGELPDVIITVSGLKITPLASAVPEEAEQLIRQAYAPLPRVKITELLLEVDDWTGFTRHFTHLKSQEVSKDRILLLTAILADAINLGLTKMAEACPGATYARLTWLQAWHIRDETSQLRLQKWSMLNFATLSRPSGAMAPRPPRTVSTSVQVVAVKPQVRSTPTTAVILECSFIRMFPTSTRRFTLR
jgi:hypothetical protein